MNIDTLHTKHELDRLGQKLKNVSWFFRLFSIIIYLLFLGYKIGIGSGNLAVNIILLIASVAYFAATIYFVRQEQLSEQQKAADKMTKLAYKWVKRASLALSCVLSVMGILVAGDHPTIFSIILAIFMPVSLVLQIILDLVLYWLGKQIARFKVVIAQDVQYLRENAGRILLDAAKGAVKFNSKKVEAEYANEYPDDPFLKDDKMLDENVATVIAPAENSDMATPFAQQEGEIAEFGSDDLSIFDSPIVPVRPQLTDGQKAQNIAKKAATIVGTMFKGLFNRKAKNTVSKQSDPNDDEEIHF